MQSVRSVVVSVSGAILLLVLGVVLPVTFSLSPAVLTLLWAVIVVALVVLLIAGTPLRHPLARLLSPAPALTTDDGRTVHIATLVTASDPVLRGYVFEGKRIVGPAVLMAGSLVHHPCVGGLG